MLYMLSDRLTQTTLLARLGHRFKLAMNCLSSNDPCHNRKVGRQLHSRRINYRSRRESKRRPRLYVRIKLPNPELLAFEMPGMGRSMRRRLFCRDVDRLSASRARWARWSYGCEPKTKTGPFGHGDISDQPLFEACGRQLCTTSERSQWEVHRVCLVFEGLCNELGFRSSKR
jgi:hypothetical protein